MHFRFHLPAAGVALSGLLLLFGLLPTAFADAPAIHNFLGTDGSDPQSGLISGRDGNFYGTTSQGGSQNAGTVYKLTPAGALTTLVSFNGSSSGSNPVAALALGRDGSFYGTTEEGGSSNEGTVFKLTTDGTPAGTTLTTLISFNGSHGDFPLVALTQGADSSFYGSTPSGGSSDDGVVFKMTTNGTPGGTMLKTLVNFKGSNGISPLAALALGSDGNFYGTTSNGGSSNNGTVFKMTPAGALTTLLNFNGVNGVAPLSALLPSSDGSFYGTTLEGGSSVNNGSGGDGTVFKLTTNGTPAGTSLATLVNFTGPNGNAPEAALVQDSGGSFYGTTSQGGGSGNGTVFKLTSAGALTTLVSFNGPNGQYPVATLAPGSDGAFYGITVAGGPGNGSGTVFHVGPPTADSGALTIPKNQPISLALTFFDPDADQSAQSYAVGIPAHGALTSRSVSYDPAAGRGVLHAVYTPSANFTGMDSFNFTVTNGFGVSSPATFSLTVGSYALQSLKFTPAIVMGGSSADGAITLASAAASAATVTLTSSDPSVLPIRSAITITPGHRTAHFTATSNAVTTTTDVVVSATLGGVTTTGTVTVSAPQAPLDSVTVSPASVKGGTAATVTVALAISTTDPVTVTLTSSNPSALPVRSSVTIAGGHRVAQFTAGSHSVTTAQTATITATANGVTKTAVVTITP